MATAQLIPQPSEHQIMDAIQDLLRYDGYKVWRNNVGAMPYQDKYGKSRMVRFGQAGMSDLFAIQPKTGRFIAIEVKTPKTINTVKPWQQDFIDQVNHYGGIGMVAWNVDMVAQKLGIKLLF